ncbi:MAG: hydrogenase formation protein HypD [Ignavibacteria bacterium]|nr:hydrogenase formation protein HypD [Ignavibacteria bacterium]
MKHLTEYRNIKLVKSLSEKIKALTTHDYRIMEICGGQTHTIMRYGIEEFLPESITLLHGPGCPVCVTATDKIDKAVQISLTENTILTSYGDMLRVPGSGQDLLSAKANGGNVMMVYSPLEAVELAKNNPDKNIVFFAVGFETTAPANAMSVIAAEKYNLDNFYLLSSMVLVPPAIEFLLSDPENEIQAFLAAGHVCTVMGYEEYIPIASKFEAPIVVTGFEPVDILNGILKAVELLESEKYEVANSYSRAVQKEGNEIAKGVINKVFKISDREWRGIGMILGSALDLNDDYKRFDAELKFKFKESAGKKDTVCIAGEILQGRKKPDECPAFGKECKPESPLGAPMVSSEGACSAYYKYHSKNQT